MKPIALVVSLLVNVALLTAFAFRPALLPRALGNFFQHDSGSSVVSSVPLPAPEKAGAKSRASSTNLGALLAKDDLHVLIARLRAAGFPNSAIRAVVEAKLNERYQAQLQALSPLNPDRPFWKPLPYGNASRVANEHLRLIAERSRLMRELLGNFADDDDGNLTPAQRRQYGALSLAKIEQLERIKSDYEEMSRMATIAMNGITLPGDREKLAVLEREKRADLVVLLSPEELEDYDMRNSPITERLRLAFAVLKATADEFREIYKIQLAFADRIDLSNGLAGLSPEERTAFMQQRPLAQAELDARMRGALGEQRYSEFKRASERDYQQLVRLTESEGLPLEAANRVYAFRDQIAPESARISDDASLSAEQKIAALQSLVQNARTQLVAYLGQSAGESYGKTATWVMNIERNIVLIRATDAQAARKAAAARGGAGTSATPTSPTAR